MDRKRSDEILMCESYVWFFLELTMKRIDENATTGVIDVADEDEEDDKSETEEKEVALSRKLASATLKE